MKELFYVFADHLQNKMADKKQIAVIISFLSTILTSLILLFQLHGIILVKLLQQQRTLQHLGNEALHSRNIALARYKRAKIRYVWKPFSSSKI